VGSNSETQGYNFYPMLLFHRKFSNGITMRIQNIAQDHIIEPSDRALVFVTTIINRGLIARSLGCEFYCADTSVYVSKSNRRLMDEGTHHRMAAEQQKGIVDNWQTG